MKAIVYAGFGSLREPRWRGDLDVLPAEGLRVVIKGRVYEVSVVNLYLSKTPHVEIYVTGGNAEERKCP